MKRKAEFKRPTHRPKWARGLRRLALGIYGDDATGQLVFDAEAILKHIGLKMTAKNDKLVRSMFEKWLQQRFGSNITLECQPVDDVYPAR